MTPTTYDPPLTGLYRVGRLDCPVLILATRWAYGYQEWQIAIPGATTVMQWVRKGLTIDGKEQRCIIIP